MRIKPLEKRVTYLNNPLAEVVCQVRFDSVSIDADQVKVIAEKLTALGYPLHLHEEVAMVAIHVGAQGVKHEGEQAPQKFHHFVSKDRFWKVSVTNEFIALTSLKYETWEDFQKRLTQALATVQEVLDLKNCQRIGLRYRDIIDRERLGLQGQPWIELLSPFVIGPLGALDLTEDGKSVPESDVETLAFQTILTLDDCKVLLQGGLIHAVDSNRKAFMIDTDFFCEGDDAHNCFVDSEKFLSTLERLHKNAGALFSAIIKEPLHHALQPSPLQ